MRKFLLLFLLPLLASAEPGKEFARFHILLVGGIYNEAQPRQFKAFEKFLRANGATHVDQMMPSSTRTVGENAPRLAEEILRLHKKSGLPVIVFGHSKGGVELINALGLRAPELTPEVLAAAVPVNSPLKGSPATDSMIKKFKAWAGLNIFTLGYKNNIRVLESISAQGIEAEFARSYAGRTPEEIRSLSERVFYVRSAQDPKKVNFLFREFANHMGDEMPNDGLVPAESQKLTQFQGVENFGTDMGIIPDRDHMGLFHAQNTEHPSQADVFRGILQKLGQAHESEGCVDKFKGLAGN